MATSNRMRPVHPGEILGEELQELGMSANALAKELGVPTNRITAILRGRRGVTATLLCACLAISARRRSCG